jgi:predicted DNA-binding transcriptional regulator AlpA
MSNRIKPHDLPLLTTARQTAEDVIGVSERKFAQLRHEAWFPKPIELGPRALRWNRVEVLEAVSRQAPRASLGREPAQLKAGRARRARPVQGSGS